MYDEIFEPKKDKFNLIKMVSQLILNIKTFGLVINMIFRKHDKNWKKISE
jgi:hypothetical protein